MDRKPAVEVPPLPGIDLKFRPATYFWPPQTHLLARLKGAEGKTPPEILIASGELDGITERLARSRLSEQERQALGRVHPALMGGAYLPDIHDNEVEIARITIASVTQDVTSVYASRGKRRFHYRVVDEYSGDTLLGKAKRTCTQTLALGELEAFFNGAWSIFDVLEMNFRERGYEPKALQKFVLEVDSAFYPQISELYRRRIAAWGAARRGELAVKRTG